MKLFGKDLYRALALGFVLGCAGMAMNVNGMISRAQAATSHVAANHFPISHFPISHLPMMGHAANN